MKQPERILVVYDSPSIKETVSVFDQNPPWQVAETNVGDDFREALEKAQPDLVVLCAMTQSSQAFSLCGDIKAESSLYLPVVIYALKISDDSRKAAYQSGADDIIQVSISPEDLYCRINSLLRIRQMVVESQRRSISLARASAEAADMMLQLEEASRRISEQNEELKLRDARISAQQEEIKQHLQTLQQEMELASALQINLLPTDSPEGADLALHDRYIPAAQLCGDYYDYVNRPGNIFHISIADVTGHGVAPALVSVQVRTLARTAVHSGKSPGEILRELNDFMINTFKQDYLMTMVCINYDPATHIAAYAGAGHCPMLLLSKNGTCRELPSRGLPLGIVAGTEFPDEQVQLAPGDKLFNYTDGIFEVTDEDTGEIFGPERLTEELTKCGDKGGRETLDHLVRTARGFSSAGCFEDDVTLVLLERLPGNG
jgi:sigma-B regulation protein RsbU (phosphoserine phosphatase)